MRFRIMILAAVAAVVALAGCGNRTLYLGVDALSFTDATKLTKVIGPYPALPHPDTISTGEQPLFSENVNLVGGTQQVVDVQAVTITFTADFDDQYGSGDDTLRVYMSDKQTEPMSTLPVVQVPITLISGQHSPVHAVISGDARVNELFTQDQIRVAVTTALGVPPNQGLSGTIKVTQLRADVVAKHHRSL